MRTSIDNKKFILTTDSGYMYSPDKKQKTLDSKVAAGWLGCSVDDLVKCYSRSWYYTGVLIEADPVQPSNRVKVSYWKICNSRPSDTGNFEVRLCTRRESDGEDDESFFWIYADGTVSHDDSSDESERIKFLKPHKIHKQPVPSINEWYDYPLAMVDMNNTFTSYGDTTFCSKTKEILKNAGFPETVYPSVHWNFKLNNYGNLMDYILMPKGKKSGKEVMSAAEKLDEFKDGETYKIDKVDNGIMFRFAINPENENLLGTVENRRVFISRKGTVSQNFLQDTNDLVTGKLTKVWSNRSSKDTTWFYKACFNNKIQTSEIQDLVIDNPKFKYLNDWINDHIEDLLSVNYEPDWGFSGLLELLRIVNKYPVIIDAMVKLGFGDDLLMCSTESTFNKDTHKVTYRTYDYRTGAYRTDSDQITVMINKFNPEIFAEGSIFGKLNKATDFFGSLGINRGQWKYILANAKEDTKPSQIEALQCLDYMKKYFCGQMTSNDWDSRSYSAWRFKYESLAEVPMNEFERLYKVWMHFAYNPDPHYYGTKGTFVADSLNRMFDLGQKNLEIHGDVEHDEELRTLELCIKRGIRYKDLEDYHRMRSQCVGIRGFELADWPLVPRNTAEIHLFHDRLVDVYNECQNERRSLEEAPRQKKYNEILPKWLKFEYEEEEDTRCVVCPRELMEIVCEGQRLEHCVGSYTESVANGNEVVLFLRDKNTKDKSYATVNILYDNIAKIWKTRQIHTYKNGDITEEDVNFLKRWAKKNKVDVNTIQTHYGALRHI